MPTRHGLGDPSIAGPLIVIFVLYAHARTNPGIPQWMLPDETAGGSGSDIGPNAQLEETAGSLQMIIDDLEPPIGAVHAR